ncbi:MAG: sulfatase-like hydrolase/transferase [Planctomycetota bacterium]
MKSFIAGLIGVVLCNIVAAQGRAVDAPRPNILVFYVDDMGWGSIGPNGQVKRAERGLLPVKTPNLDRLAAEGVNFSRGYGCTVCSPARSSLQTGFHQGHTYADRNDPDNAKKAIRREDPSIGTSLGGVGYATGYWGKWGYGGSKDKVTPAIVNVQTLPTSHGYKHVLAELHHVRAHTFFQPTLWSAPAKPSAKGGLELIPNSMEAFRDDSSWPSVPALQNHPDYPPTGYCDDAYAFAALRFVREQAERYNKTRQPFHGILAVQIPHAPFDEITALPLWDQAYAAEPQFKELSPQAQQWAAMVTRIDAHFGNLLDALEDPNQDGDTSDSVADHTLVVFKSDNGGPRGNSLKEFETNGGLRGTKGSIYEGGIRVPMLMRWPAKIHARSELKPGSSCDRIVDVTDLLPTFCELAGAEIPLGIDGVSIAPLLTGVGVQRKREFVIHEAGRQSSIIRGNWKFVLSSRSNGAELYDLASDPGETQNVVAKHEKLARQLQRLLVDERVNEPRGFANTYHRWVGPDKSVTSDESNWSDYRYSNDGVLYLSDDGAPRPSWVASLIATDESNVASVDKDLRCLAIEISGNDTNRQLLVVPDGVTVEGRNEVRVGKGGTLVTQDATIRSMRAINIERGGQLLGNGTLDADVWNYGRMILKTPKDKPLKVSRDFRQFESGVLSVGIDENLETSIEVTGTAFLGGELDLLSLGSMPQSGLPRVILSADRVVGRFETTSDALVAPDGRRFTLVYTDDAVALKPL